MFRPFLILITTLGVVGMGCNEAPKSAPLENSFLTITAPELSNTHRVNTRKVLSTPGSKRSYIILEMKASDLDPEVMKTVLLALDAFEKHFGVKIQPGGWNIEWEPRSSHGYGGYLHGICVDHDRPIDLSTPFGIQLDEVGTTAEKEK